MEQFSLSEMVDVASLSYEDMDLDSYDDMEEDMSTPSILSYEDLLARDEAGIAAMMTGKPLKGLTPWKQPRGSRVSHSHATLTPYCTYSKCDNKQEIVANYPALMPSLEDILAPTYLVVKTTKPKTYRELLAADEATLDAKHLALKGQYLASHPELAPKGQVAETVLFDL